MPREMWPPPLPILTGSNLWHHISARSWFPSFNSKHNTRILESLQTDFSESWIPSQWWRGAWEVDRIKKRCVHINQCSHISVVRSQSKLLKCPLGRPTLKVADVKGSPTNICRLRKIRSGAASPKKHFEIFWTWPKTIARPAQLRKTYFVLTCLKVTCPQIQYLVHFTFKV